MWRITRETSAVIEPDLMVVPAFGRGTVTLIMSALCLTADNSVRYAIQVQTLQVGRLQVDMIVTMVISILVKIFAIMACVYRELIVSLPAQVGLKLRCTDSFSWVVH